MTGIVGRSAGDIGVRNASRDRAAHRIVRTRGGVADCGRSRGISIPLGMDCRYEVGGAIPPSRAVAGGLMKGPALFLSARYLGKGLDAVPRNPDSASPGENSAVASGRGIRHAMDRRAESSATRTRPRRSGSATSGGWSGWPGPGWHVVRVPTRTRKMRP